jgi:hypothetical protein
VLDAGWHALRKGMNVIAFAATLQMEIKFYKVDAPAWGAVRQAANLEIGD